jgi:hypothetical protein
MVARCGQCRLLQLSLKNVQRAAFWRTDEQCLFDFFTQRELVEQVHYFQAELQSLPNDKRPGLE